MALSKRYPSILRRRIVGRPAAFVGLLAGACASQLVAFRAGFVDGSMRPRAMRRPTSASSAARSAGNIGLGVAGGGRRFSVVGMRHCTLSRQSGGASIPGGAPNRAHGALSLHLGYKYLHLLLEPTAFPAEPPTIMLMLNHGEIAVRVHSYNHNRNDQPRIPNTRCNRAKETRKQTESRLVVVGVFHSCCAGRDG